jgi:hypothetical protein
MRRTNGRSLCTSTSHLSILAVENVCPTMSLSIYFNSVVLFLFGVGASHRCILRRRKCFMFHLMWIFACFVYTNLILQSPVERFKENR